MGDAPRYKPIQNNHFVNKKLIRNRVIIDSPVSYIFDEITDFSNMGVVFEQILDIIPIKQLSRPEAKQRKSVKNRFLCALLDENKNSMLHGVRVWVFDKSLEEKSKITKYIKDEVGVDVNCSENILSVYFKTPATKQNIYKMVYVAEIICWLGELEEINPTI